MSQPGTFDRVYAAIKQRLRAGGFRPGERLEPAILSDELNASVTPVRDALHRLTGERLVEAPRHEGFRVPLLSESMLRHLYAWHLDLLLLASARHKAEASTQGPEPDNHLAYQRLNNAFARFASESGNPELAATLKNLAERLDPYRRFEQEFLDRLEDESERIIAAIRAQDRRELRNRLVRYHRRRHRIVPELLERQYAAPFENNRPISDL
jgi:DNA-binding GntR family transcriptional regulator